MRKLFVLLTMTVFLVFFVFPMNAISQCPKEVYNGTYSGDDDGVWFIVLDPSPPIVVIIPDNSDYPIIPWDVEKTVEPNNGKIIVDCSHGSATIDPSGAVSGTWKIDDKEGTLSGSKHVDKDISEFAGRYTGIFTGDDSGKWSAPVNSDGSVTVSILLSECGSDSGNGTICPNGYLKILTKGGAEFIIVVDSNWWDLPWQLLVEQRNVIGIWENEKEEYFGVIRGSREVSPGSRDNGDGCFISSIMSE